ncbi:DUF2793 domain-containing protein [Bauldia sp.]|uniref:DUF2793 domain-containing protein n=1 Tax=Bauldia sp. TaxID=2575872 RepID=UPI003BAA9D77
MSDPLASPTLGLPYLAGAQAQKHVTHNEALRRLDALVSITVIDSTLTDPPVSPAEGDRYIVPAGATGDWSGHQNDVAAFQDGAWAFYTPLVGWIAFDQAASGALVFSAGAWSGIGGFLGPVDQFGINATADATNRLAVRSNAVLFNGLEVGSGGDGDVRFVVNKEADGDTASLLFQSGFSGRAEVGLAGDTDFVFKVSANGSSWVESIRIDKDTGVSTILYDNATSGLTASDVQAAVDELAAEKQASLGFTPREALSADRTYYVDATLGSDSNNGLSLGAGAFLTLQKALDVCATIDFSGYAVTVRLADGTYNGAHTVPVCVGQATREDLVIEGNPVTPANVIVNNNAGGFIGAIHVPSYARCTVQHLTITASVAGAYGLSCETGTLYMGSGLIFGTGATVAHIVAYRGGFIMITDDYAITAGAPRHARTVDGGILRCTGKTVTLTGTPNFSVAFLDMLNGGDITWTGATFTGAATGKEYQLNYNAGCKINATAAGYFPGDVAGTADNGAVIA